MSDFVENERIVQFMEIQSDGLELFKKKNADYGDYGDAFAQHGVIGVITR